MKQILTYMSGQEPKKDLLGMDFRNNILQLGDLNLDDIGEEQFWPVPDSYSDKLPEENEPGSFWEHREDRYHCGVDIYADAGKKVIAIENGIVLDIREFTSPEMNYYWNTTYAVVIKSSGNIIYKYAELSDVLVRIGNYVDGGQPIGTIGMVINQDRLSMKVPFYIRKLITNGNPSMLHLEMYKSPISQVEPYSCGNYFGTYKPESLLNPLHFLYNLKKK